MAIPLGHAVEAPFPSRFISTLSDSLSPSHGLPSLLNIFFTEPDQDLRLIFRPLLSLSPQGFFPLLLFLFLLGSLLLFLFFPQLDFFFYTLPSLLWPFSACCLSVPFLGRSFLPWLWPIRGPSVPSFKVPCAPSLVGPGPGDKIWDQIRGTIPLIKY